MTEIFSFLSDMLTKLGVKGDMLEFATTGEAWCLAILFCLFLYYVILTPIAHMVDKRVAESETPYDDVLLSPAITKGISVVIMAIVVNYLFPPLTLYYPSHLHHVEKGCTLLLIASVAWALVLEIRAFCVYLRMRDIMRSGILVFRNIMQTTVFAVAGLLAISTLLNRDVAYVVSALGAMAAVLILVFKDSILGMIAGIRLSINGLMKENDWVTVPKYNADGRVEDITLTSVKIRNWDKSVATIPPYALVSEGFINRQRMLDLGVRQIKRLFYVDINSVRHLSPEESARFENEEWTEGIDLKDTVNLSLFRRWLRHKMTSHPKLAVSTNPEMPYQIIVKGLPSTPTGIPVEIMFFVKCPDWAEFEEMQADFIDDITASFPRFFLRHFQYISDTDFLPRQYMAQTSNSTP